jgi:hypothetical protein
MKQTAVELFNQEIKELFSQYLDAEISASMFHFQRLAALTQAKEMEKQQIIDFAHEIADELAYDVYSKKVIEDIFKKTFKSE